MQEIVIDKHLPIFYNASMIHEISLVPSSFDRIASGAKTIELRLYDEKRRKIKLGDIIEFTKNETDEKMQRRVIGLLNFPNFETLIDYLPLELFGHENKANAKAGVVLDGFCRTLGVERNTTKQLSLFALL